MSDEIELLRSRVAELEAALGLKNETITSRYKLTPAMSSLLGLLVEMPIVTEEAIKEQVRIAADAKVAVYRLRRQLAPYGIEIHSRRGSGWYLDNVTKDSIRLAVTSPVIAEAA